MRIGKVIKGTSLTLLAGLAFATAVTPVAYAAETDKAVSTAKTTSADSTSLQQSNTGVALKNTAADNVAGGLTKTDGSVNYAGLKDEIKGMDDAQLGQVKSQILASNQKTLDTLKDAKTSAVSTNDVKASLLKLNVNEVKEQLNGKKQSLIESLNQSDLDASQKQKQLDQFNQFVDGLNNLTQAQYVNYVNGLSSAKIEQLTADANKVIANIPALKQKLTDQNSQLNKLSGQALKDYFVKQVKLSEQQYLYAKENPSQTVTQDTRKGPIQTIVEDTLAGFAIGGLITSAPVMTIIAVALTVYFGPLAIAINIVFLIFAVVTLPTVIFPLIALLFVGGFDIIFPILWVGGTALTFVLYGALGAIPGAPIGFAVGVAQALTGGKVAKDPTQTNPQFIKYSQSLDDGSTVDLARKLEIKKGNTYTIETQAFTQNTDLLRSPYPSSLAVGIFSSSTAMVNVDKDTIDNVKGDFSVADGKTGTITFDAKKDGTVYLAAIAQSPELQSQGNYNNLGVNLNIWRVNVFQHAAPTQTTSSQSSTQTSTGAPTNSVDQKLVAGIDAQ